MQQESFEAAHLDAIFYRAQSGILLGGQFKSRWSRD